MKNENRSQYFQSIARHFLKLRGSPFFLSSKELHIIETWEKMKIPLQVVLEGVDRAFEKNSLKRARKGKILSLVFCNLQVLRAFEQFRDRRVGSKNNEVGQEKKREKAIAEVKRFLENTPLEVDYLREVFVLVLRRLSCRNINEEELEQREREIEELLFEKASDIEKDEIRREILAEYEFAEKEEFQRVFKLRLLKHLREMYKIPYVSLYYY
ncbi:MAG: hypothetical protein JSV96_16815 [Candidatus Aminicenantes bacterium]|nr:MAG: hypothetical protein JSV96_16815 [Candidatus Aminicenantes bacterium]